eukprot:2869979-Rhodomonas_salina.1
MPPPTSTDTTPGREAAFFKSLHRLPLDERKLNLGQSSSVRRNHGNATWHRVAQRPLLGGSPHRDPQSPDPMHWSGAGLLFQPPAGTSGRSRSSSLSWAGRLASSSSSGGNSAPSTPSRKVRLGGFRLALSRQGSRKSSFQSDGPCPPWLSAPSCSRSLVLFPSPLAGSASLDLSLWLWLCL